MTDDGVTEMNATPEAEVIYNTWHQIGPDGWAIGPLTFQPSRGEPIRVGWQLWRWKRPSDLPQGISSLHSACKVEDRDCADGSGRKQARSRALYVIMLQAEAATGIPADGWVRNRMGDYVPREIAKARPLRKLDDKR
jgi:hypothetical protein